MKRFLCLFLVLITFVLTGVSCGNTNNNNDNDDVSTDDIVTEAPETEVPTTEAETEAPPVLADYDLKDFKIVYTGSHLADLAESFQKDVKELTNVELEIVKGDSKDNGEYEFIIGKANRSISNVCFNHTTFKYRNSVGVYCENGKVQILGIDRTTIKDSIKYFFANVLTEAKTTISIPEVGALYNRINLKNVDIPAKADPSQIRIVTNNILMHSLTDKWGVPTTQNRVSELIGAYSLIDPDVVMFQEVDKGWYTTHRLILEMKNLGYSFVTTSKDNNPVPIFYKTSRFKLLGGANEKYDSSKVEGGPYENRYYTWACLEEIATGKQIVVTSTHFVASLTNVDSKYTELYRQESAKQLVAFSERIKTKYPKAVVIMAGDYNAGLSSESHRIMSEGLLSARDSAEKKVNINYKTTCSLGKSPARGNPPSVIDHIFYSKEGITAKHYEVVVSKYTYAYSDHVPVLVDFKLK